MVREKKQRVMAKAWLGVLAGEIKMTMYQELMVFSCDSTNMNFVVGYMCYDSMLLSCMIIVEPLKCLDCNFEL